MILLGFRYCTHLTVLILPTRFPIVHGLRSRCGANRLDDSVVSCRAWLFICLLVWVGFCPEVCAQKPIADQSPRNVVLLTGSRENVPFWELFADFMRHASDDLDIKVKVLYAENSLQRMATMIREECSQENKPDAVVVQAFKVSGQSSLRIANQNQVPVFLVNSGLSEEQKTQVGPPRGQLRYWIGEMIPDDEGAGFQLANELIDEALRRGRVGPDGRVHLIGINGTVSDFASIKREAGLLRAAKARSKDAVLHQVIEANWERDRAQKRCRILHRRYPHTTVVWTASDHMALGVIQAMRDLELRPGEDVIIGGVDATEEGLALINQGTMHATIGGHFMEGGWVAIMLYDFLNGVDPKRIPPESASPMTLVTADNLDEYQVALKQDTWRQFDFRRLTLSQHPELAAYPFLREGANILAKHGAFEDTPVDAKQQDLATEDSGTNE